MTQRCGTPFLMLILGSMVLLWPVGCSMPSNPWRFADPPAKTTSVRPTAAHEHQPMIVVVGRFDDPSRAPNYSQGVGQAMSDAFSRALRGHGGFEVRMNQQLAAEARRYARFDAVGIPAGRNAATNLTPEQQQARDRLQRDRADVDYVVIGKVTDFYHTRDLPDEASRRGIIGRRNEAVVSFDLRIVDMHTMQVVGTDHLMGSVDAGRARSHELYENIALDSYLFWSTPLGRAGRRAVERAVVRAVALMPTQSDRDETMLAVGNADDTAENETIQADETSTAIFTTQRAASQADSQGQSIATTSQRFANVRPQILRTEGSRRVTIMGGRNINIRQGDRFYILREAVPPSPAVASDAMVKDPVTGRPLRLSITEVSETTATGWILGQKPRQLDLRGMLLHPQVAETGPATAHAVPTHDAAP